MTAPVPNRNTPIAAVGGLVSSGFSTVSSFVVGQAFAQNQAVKVYVRFKPLVEEEQEANEKKKIKDDKKVWDIKHLGVQDSIMERGALRKIDGKSLFNVDQVFDENAQTPLLYKSIARSMVHSVLSGKHATILAYGQSGTGKTYTMQGDGKAVSGQAGLIQLVVSDILRFTKLGEQSTRDFTINVSYIEVYNERGRDLLSDDLGDNASFGTPKGSAFGNNLPDLDIRTSSTGEVTMNCVNRQINTVEDALELLVMGNANRVVSKKDATRHSSKSNGVFRINVQSTSKEMGVGAEIVRVADFNLVDLADPDTTALTTSSTKKPKEMTLGNQSIAALSNIIEILSLPPKKRPKQMNYGESKLTRILQPHLAGNAEMAVICCLSPTKSYLEDSRATLKFGIQARQIKVNPKVNELNDDSALIKKLQSELEVARQKIEQYRREGIPEDDRIDAPKTIGVPRSKMTAADAMSTDTGSINYDEVSLGYDDMDAGPGHREFDFVSNQELPPPKNWEEGEKIPGMGGREYVMPKNMEGLPPELKEAQLANPDDTEAVIPPGGDEEPKNQNLAEIPLDLGKDFKENDTPDRTSSVDLDRLLKGDDSVSDGALSLNNSVQLDLDMEVDPEGAKAARKYLQESNYIADANSSEHGSAHSSGYGSGSGHQSTGKGKGSRLDQTGPTEDDTYDGPIRSFAGMSEKFGTLMSKPETVRGPSLGRSKQGTIRTFDNFHSRHGDDISWDTINLKTLQPEQAGRPLKAIQSLYHHDDPVPDEITIMRLSNIDTTIEDPLCLTDKLIDAEARSDFMQTRLETADDLVEGIFKDLERARLCIHDLVYRNTQLSAKLKDKQREDVKAEYEDKEVVAEQYWMLKGAMYVGLFFFISGGYEFFMASVFLVWLILEINLGPKM